MNIAYIAKENGLSPETVRKIFEQAMSNYSKHIINLPRVLLFYEFKADTDCGKYSFVLNDLIHRKCLDVLPDRKKRIFIKLFYTLQ